MADVTILPFGGVTPDVARAAFVAPGTRIMGDVVLGEDSSIWYNCVLRGDVGRIRIGARTNVQDGTVIHCDSEKNGYGGHPTLIGADVLIGHMVMLHGCLLHDRAFVGMCSTVMDGCEIESDGMLAAGALLTPGKRIGAGQMWVGRPAKYVRDLTEAEIAANLYGVAHYVGNARAHAEAVAAARGA